MPKASLCPLPAISTRASGLQARTSSRSRGRPRRWQRARERRERQQLAADEKGLHGANGVGHARDRARRELEERRVDGRVVLVVHPLADGVAQREPARRLRPVAPAIGIAAVELDAAFPHVAVDVVAQERRRRHERHPPGERQAEAEQEPAPAEPARRRERDEIRGEREPVTTRGERRCAPAAARSRPTPARKPRAARPAAESASARAGRRSAAIVARILAPAPTVPRSVPLTLLLPMRGR